MVGSAFRLAYSQQLQEPHSAAAPTQSVLLSPSELISTWRDDKPKPAARACWAKKLVGKTKHSDPLVNQAIELSNQSFGSNISETSNIQESTMNNSRSNRSRPNNLPSEWLASGGGSSSEDNNSSPPDVNSYRQVRDKPLMSKNLGVIRQENDLSEDLTHRDTPRQVSSNHGSRQASCSRDCSRLIVVGNLEASRSASGSNRDGSRSASGGNPDGSRAAGNPDRSRLPSGGNRDSSRSASGRSDSRSASRNRDIATPVTAVIREGSRPPAGGNRDRSRPGNNGNGAEGSSSRPHSGVRSEGFSALRRCLGGRNQTPSAPPTDEESLIESSTGRSSRRSSRSSIDPSSASPSLSDVNSPNGRLDGSGRQKRSQSESDAGVTPPPPPERFDSLSLSPEEELELRSVAWFQAGISREIALEILELEPVGAFMVRQSTTKPGCFALSLRVPRNFHPTGIAHYLIMRTKEGGYKIKGFTKEFHTLKALVTHHSVMPELLPCPLSKSQFNLLYRRKDKRDFVDLSKKDPDYDLLSNLRPLISDKA